MAGISIVDEVSIHIVSEATNDWGLQDGAPKLQGLQTSSNIHYSHPQIDGKVNNHQISRDLLFHLFGDYYNYSPIYHQP